MGGRSWHGRKLSSGYERCFLHLLMTDTEFGHSQFAVSDTLRSFVKLVARGFLRVLRFPPLLHPSSV